MCRASRTRPKTRSRGYRAAEAFNHLVVGTRPRDEHAALSIRAEAFSVTSRDFGSRLTRLASLLLHAPIRCEVLPDLLDDLGVDHLRVILLRILLRKQHDLHRAT